MQRDLTTASYLQQREASVFRTLKEICEIPSPTFHEQAKIRHLVRLLRSLGLTDVHIDGAGNAIGFLIADPKRKKFVLLSAHADTACTVPIPIRVRDDGAYLRAHGICDDSAGVTALLTFLRFVKEERVHLRKNYLVAFTVCEEGLGAKRGMKAVMKTYAKSIASVVNVESHDIGRITHACVGQYRARLTVTTKQKGAHSYHDFGEPNAVVILSTMIHDLSQVPFPRGVTYNVTAAEGGGRINVIPDQAQCLVEFRAEKQKDIDRLVTRFEGMVKRRKGKNVTCTLEVLATTQAARMPKHLPMYRIARRVITSLGIKPFFSVGNTDGDVPMAMGVPTITLGSAHGFATHSPEEKLLKKTYLQGVGQVMEVILALDEAE